MAYVHMLRQTYEQYRKDFDPVKELTAEQNERITTLEKTVEDLVKKYTPDIKRELLEAAKSGYKCIPLKLRKEDFKCKNMFGGLHYIGDVFTMMMEAWIKKDPDMEGLSYYTLGIDDGDDYFQADVSF